jgi:hypothetical protein
MWEDKPQVIMAVVRQELEDLTQVYMVVAVLI